MVINDVPLARLPDWLFDWPSRPVKEKKHSGGPLVATAQLPKPLYLKVLRLVPLSAVVTRHHQRRVIGILNIALRRQDHRNDGLNIAGFCMRELIRNGIISSPAAQELLIEVANLNGYAAKDGFIAVEKTIRSGLGLAPWVGHWGGFQVKNQISQRMMVTAAPPGGFAQVASPTPRSVHPLIRTSVKATRDNAWSRSSRKVDLLSNRSDASKIEETRSMRFLEKLECSDGF